MARAQVGGGAWGLSVHLTSSPSIVPECPPPFTSPLSLVLPFLSRSSSSHSLVRLCSDLFHLCVFLLPPPFSTLLVTCQGLPSFFFLLDPDPSIHSRPLQTPHTSTPPRSQHSHDAFRRWPRAIPLASLLFAPWELRRRSAALATPKPFPLSHQKTSPNSPGRVSLSASPSRPRPGSSWPQGPSRLLLSRPPLQTRSAGWAGSLRTHSCEEGVRAGLDPRTPRAGGSWTQRYLGPQALGWGYWRR